METKRNRNSAKCCCSLSEDDLATGTDVLAGLGRALVLAGLQSDDALAGVQRFLGEVAFALVGGLRPQERTLEFRVFVALGKKRKRTLVLLNYDINRSLKGLIFSFLNSITLSRSKQIFHFKINYPIAIVILQFF